MKLTLSAALVGASALSAALILAGCSSSSGSGSGNVSTDAKSDVTVTACGLDTLDVTDVDSGTEEKRQVPTATVEVKNPTTATAAYDITVSFTSKDGATTFAEGEGLIESVAGGGSKTGKVQSEDAAEGEISCTVTEVIRVG